MDPVTLLLLCLVAGAITVRTMGVAVVDVVAQAKGKKPPSHERWEKRQAERARKGLKPEKKPSLLGLWWRQAAEEQALKMAQKHRAKMEILDEDADKNVENYKAKQRAKAKRKAARAERAAKRFDELGAKTAEWAATSWQACKDAYATAKDHYDEYRDEKDAWDENAGRTADPADEEPIVVDGTVEPEPVAEPSTGTTDDNVIPLRPRLTPDSSTERKPAMTTATAETAAEITDLDTAIAYCETTSNFGSSAAAQARELAAQMDDCAAASGGESEACDGQVGNLNTLGFDDKITGDFSAAIEQLNLAKAEAEQAANATRAAAEALTAAASAMNAAKRAFESQQGIAENVGAAAETTGVAESTEFYGAKRA